MFQQKSAAIYHKGREDENSLLFHVGGGGESSRLFRVLLHAVIRGLCLIHVTEPGPPLVLAKKGNEGMEEA